MMGKRNRYRNENNVILTPEGLMLAHKMLIDKDYEKKVADLMAIMQGRRIAGRQGLGSPVWRD
jgi:hypothetical protein